MGKEERHLVNNLLDDIVMEYGNNWDKLDNKDPRILKVRELLGAKIKGEPVAERQVGEYFSNGKFIRNLGNVKQAADRIDLKESTLVKYITNDQRKAPQFIYKYIQKGEKHYDDRK